MKTIEIYANYGVLAAEKRTVYTFDGAHTSATCSEKMTVVVPDGWEIYQNQMGQTMVTAPWGWDYDINEVLTDINGRAAFRALDKNMSYKTAYLFTPEELEERAEKEREKQEKGKKKIKIYEVKKGKTEIAYKDRKEIKTLCTLDKMGTDAESLGKFHTEEEAVEECKKHLPDLREYPGLFVIEECYIEIYEEDENGEFVSGSDYDTPIEYEWDEETENIKIL